jgi:cytochrome P450
MDISADLAYSRELHQMQRSKRRETYVPLSIAKFLTAVENSPILDSLWGVNFFAALSRTMKQFPLLNPLKLLFLPPSLLATLPKAIALNKQEARKRVERRGATQHLDYFEHICPADSPDPAEEEIDRMEVLAFQLLNGGYEPISSQFLCTIIFLLQQPKSYERLVKEVRGAFTNYQDITPEACAHLKFLHASLMETLRVTVIGANGMPRTSPGATVDGHYIPKGVSTPFTWCFVTLAKPNTWQVTVQFGHFAFTRSARYFHDANNFRPERYLPRNHPYWDPAFENDHVDDFKPFSQGPRICPGMGAAWR